MKFINLTPHTVKIELPDGTLYGILSEGLARCGQIDTNPREAIIENVDSDCVAVRVFTRSYGTVEGLPDSKPGIGYIVSQIVAQALPTRFDLFFPGDLLRDENGNIIGCKNLCQVS